MNLETVTKLNMRNTATSKKIDDDVVSANCEVFVIFLIHDQVIQKPGSGSIFLTRSKNRAEKSLTQLL